MTGLPVSQTHPAVGLAVTRIHVDRPLAVLDGKVVVVHLTVRSCAVAVEHGVASVKLDRLGVHLEGVDKLFRSHQVVSLRLQPLCFLLISRRGGRLLLQLRKKRESGFDQKYKRTGSFLVASWKIA